MKLTNKQLKQIIEEEVAILESQRSTQTQDLSKEDKDAISDAIKTGDAAHEAIKSDMKERHGPALIESTAIEIARDIDAFIENNPGIVDAKDISSEKLNSIKRDATKRVLTEFKAQYSSDVLVNTYVDDLTKRMGYSATPHNVQALFKRYM